MSAERENQRTGKPGAAPSAPPGSWASSYTTRRAMQANRRVDTQPELRLRSALHRLGLRFRRDRGIEAGDVRVKADVVFSGSQVAVFVDGCFWHGCPEHGEQPRANADYWRAKIERNRRRDRRIDAALAEDGWLSMRVWEHEDPEFAAARVRDAVRARRRAGRTPR